MKLPSLKFMVREISTLYKKYHLLASLLGVIMAWSLWGGIQVLFNHHPFGKIFLDGFFIVSFTLCSGLFLHLYLTWKKGKFQLIRLYSHKNSSCFYQKNPRSLKLHKHQHNKNKT